MKNIYDSIVEDLKQKDKEALEALQRNQENEG